MEWRFQVTVRSILIHEAAIHRSNRDYRHGADGARRRARDGRYAAHARQSLQQSEDFVNYPALAQKFPQGSFEGKK
jgi:hypothetical protein